MCGLTVAILTSHDTRASRIRDKVAQSLKNISHRGPDASDIKVDGNISLGHCRLSIIDLTNRSNQPMTGLNERYLIVFNGEIYNYQEIRSLIPDWEFKTESDTEVLLAAFHKWGNDCFKQFIGQFAVCIYDKASKKLTVSRDMSGEKPLLIHRNKEEHLPQL